MQTDPHNHSGLSGRSIVQVFKLPFDCQAIFLSPHTDFSGPPALLMNAVRAISSCRRRFEFCIIGATIVTSNLPFDEWTSVFGSERLTGALLDRLTHHVHILEMNGESYRLAHSERRKRTAPPDATPQE